MKNILTFALLICNISLCKAQNTTGNTEIPIVVNTLDELSASKTNVDVAIVKDEHRGGIFTYTKSKLKPDDGVVFKSTDKGFWVRVYNKYQGVDIAWFGAKMDSVTNDADALKKALNYDLVNITGLLKVEGKFALKEGKTIAFSNGGGILLADSCILNFDAYIKTEDYSYIFRGNGSVIFGQKSTLYVSPCWFGARADCNGYNAKNSTDNTPAIQKSILAAEKVSDIYLPPTAANTFYRIASGITITKKIHFFSLKFHGGGTTINTNGSDKATTIFADFTSGPAINIQGSRRSYISDFKLIGRNQAPKKISAGRGNGSHYISSYDTITYFYDSDISRNYAGIATDAEKANKVWSADIQFDRLQIEGFYVGLNINAAGNVQGDRMRVNNTQINNCTYGISIGNPQARACNFENVDMNYVYIAYTNSIFGNGTGSEFEITGGQYCNIYKLFHIQPYNLGQCVVTGLYAEALGNIGEIGYGGPNDNSFVFTGCSIHLLDIPDLKVSNYGYYSKYYTLTAFANLSFIGCNFWTLKPYLAFCAGNKDMSIHPLINLSGCSFNRSTFFHGWGNVNIENTHFVPKAETETIDMNRTIRKRMDGNWRYNTGYYATTVIPLFDGLSTDSTNPTSAMQISRTIPMFYSVQDGGNAITDISIKIDTVTFSYTDSLEAKLFRYVLPGDVLGTTLKEMQTEWDNPTLKVLSVDHSAKKAHVIMYTETFSFDKIALYTNCFFTTQPISGDIKEGSNTITNTKNEMLLQEGDFITFKNAERPYRISKINNEAHTIELMDNIKEKENTNIVLYNLQLYSCNK